MTCDHCGAQSVSFKFFTSNSEGDEVRFDLCEDCATAAINTLMVLLPPKQMLAWVKNWSQPVKKITS